MQDLGLPKPTFKKRDPYVEAMVGILARLPDVYSNHPNFNHDEIWDIITHYRWIPQFDLSQNLESINDEVMQFLNPETAGMDEYVEESKRLCPKCGSDDVLVGKNEFHCSSCDKTWSQESQCEDIQDRIDSRCE